MSTPDSYYGRPVIKAPVWRHDVPAYFFTGGLAAGSALVAAGADLTGRVGLRRAARLSSLGALGAGTYFLIHDLGRPERFHRMLRVAKPTSPMSTGTWMLTAFGPAAGLAAATELAELTGLTGRRGHRGRLGRRRTRRVGRPWRWLPAAGRVAGLVAAGLAPGVGTYTAVLIADTAVPSWHEAYPYLPFVFAGSALASASGVSLLAAPVAETGPARRLAVAGAALELAGARRLETGLGLVGDPYRQGRAGRLLRAGRVLTALGVAGAVLCGQRRIGSILAGTALVVAGVATRFGIYHAGVVSARDPRYTVRPQQDRLGSAP